MNEKLENILSLIAEYMEEKHSKKEWTPNKDWVRYAGPYFSSDEFVKATESLLSEWLVLGADAMAFERKFPKLFGKEHGILTNSGSSSNLIMMSAMRSKRLYNFPEKTKVIVPIAGFPNNSQSCFSSWI